MAVDCRGHNWPPPSRAAREAVPLDLFPRTIEQALLAAIGFEPLLVAGQSYAVRPLRHEHHARAVDRGQLGQIRIDLLAIGRPIDHELQLPGIVLDQATHDVRPVPRALMTATPTRVLLG